MRLLIAEDDPTSREILATILRKDGHEVIETVDGRHAHEEMSKPDAPDMAILDWMMPEMDGPDLVQAIRAQQGDQPPYLILLTARNEKADIIRGLDCGANDYLTKPFDFGELRSRIGVGKRLLELQGALAAKVEELQRALEEVKSLRGILPICASCKKIRDDSGYWQQVEEYVRDHSDVQFSHGICPGCMKNLYPDLELPDESGEATT